MTLDELMVNKKATNHMLAKLSGYSEKTVTNARRGVPVKKSTMAILLETLNTKEFNRDRRGAQRSYSRRLFYTRERSQNVTNSNNPNGN